MPARHQVRTAFLILRKKTLSARELVLPLGGGACLLVFIWIADTFTLSFRAYLFFFPYIFLFLSQEMFRDELDSGALESVLFAGGGHRDYLLSKNPALAGLALALSAGGFAFYAAVALALGRMAADDVVRFLIGLVVGLYYLAAGGCLSFFLKGGANALVILLGQAGLGAALMLSLTGRRGWAAALLAGVFPDAASRLRFLGLSLFFPNAVIAARRPFAVFAIGAATLCLFGWERRRIRGLELSRK